MPPLEAVDVRFFLAFLVPSIGFLIWFIKRVLDDRKASDRRQKARDNLVRALFAEIDFNTRDMEIFLEKSRSLSAIKDALKADPNLIPHVTDARHTVIYRNNIGALHEVSDQILADMVNFYGLLEKIRVQIDAIQNPSFRTISPEGRGQVIMLIKDTAFEAMQSGDVLLSRMAHTYGPIGLARKARRGADPSLDDLVRSRAELEARLEQAKARHALRDLVR